LQLDNEFFWSLTPYEFSKLVEYFKMNEKVKDYRAGIIATMIANANRDAKKKKTPYKPSDFFPSLLEKQKEEKSPEEMLRIAETITKLLG
jgi:flagellar basal body rod protein FlgB